MGLKPAPIEAAGVPGRGIRPGTVHEMMLDVQRERGDPDAPAAADPEHDSKNARPGEVPPS